MNYKQQDNCTKWQFKNIPEFNKGTFHRLFADCGTGMNDDINTETEDNSFMHIFTDVKDNDVMDYVQLLKNNRYEELFSNDICGNKFFRFAAKEGSLYISYMKNDAIMRIILDRSSDNCKSFGYSVCDKINNDTVFAQYSLHYDAMIRGTTCDCGMNYVYRLHDNSLIIIDGGEMEQATDIAVDDYINFLRELTNTKAGEKIRISLWLCTHAHNDHSDFFAKLIRFHSDEFIVERAAFNFPLNSNVKHSPSMAVIKARLKENYPQIKYLKFHAGSKFNIAEAEIEILVSAEDAVGTDEEDDFPNMNSTSSLFTVTADGVRTLFLADCTDDNGNVLVNNYDEKYLEATILQAAHHGINEIDFVYKKLKAEKLLLPQCMMNMHTRFEKIYDNYCRHYGKDNILPAHDRTDIFTMKDGKYTHSTRRHIGTAYDNSEW